MVLKMEIRGADGKKKQPFFSGAFTAGKLA